MMVWEPRLSGKSGVRRAYQQLRCRSSASTRLILTELQSDYGNVWGPPSPNDKPITNKSGRTVMCVKFQKEMPGLDAAPWPGEIGQRVYENVSAQAWKLWEERQKMILNEYRLMPWQKEGQELIRTQMEDFFFGEGSALPPDYVPQQTK